MLPMANDMLKKQRKRFAAVLVDWFTDAMRSLPWRSTYAPYSVWISEIMLQQTQMERGVRYFNDWMRRFPDIGSVADAREQDILAAWEGLGYYSRARNLHAAAKRIVTLHGGEFPSDPGAIRALPGIGEYTAGAIASIAFNLPVPAVDANVLRIFSRLRDIDTPVSDTGVKADVTTLVEAIMPAENPRLFNQALMELGALICGKAAKCSICPIATFCLARERGTVALRPVKIAKTGYTLHEMAAGIVFRGNRILIRKRPAEGLWAGLWEFPGGPLRPGESPAEAVVRGIDEETGLAVTVREKIAVVRHGYTTNRVTLHGFLCDVDLDADLSCASGEIAWIAPEKTGRYAFPAGHRKLLERLGWKRV